MPTANPRDRSSLYSTARDLGRTILTLLGFTVLLFPPVALVVPPDPYTQMFALGLLLPLLLVAAVGYVHLGGSVHQLGWFVAAVHLLIIPLWVPYAALVVLLRSLGISPGAFDVVGQALLLLADYAGAYYLVYRGGYDRLRTWFGELL